MRKLLIALILLPFMAHAQFTVGAGYSTKNYADLFGRYNIGQNGIILGIGYQVVKYLPKSNPSRYYTGSNGLSIYSGYSNMIFSPFGIKLIVGYNRQPGYEVNVPNTASGKTPSKSDALFGGGFIFKANKRINLEAEYLNKEKFVFDISFNL